VLFRNSFSLLSPYDVWRLTIVSAAKTCPFRRFCWGRALSTFSGNVGRDFSADFGILGDFSASPQYDFERFWRDFVNFVGSPFRLFSGFRDFGRLFSGLSFFVQKGSSPAKPSEWTGLPAARSYSLSDQNREEISSFSQFWFNWLLNFPSNESVRKK